MADPIQLSDLQLEVLRVFWEQGEATAASVHAALQRDRDLAPTTVSTLLTRLEKRGLLKHRADGRQFVYSACVEEQEVRSSMLQRLTDFFFRGDAGALVSHLVESRDFNPDELEAVEQLIRARESNESDDGIASSEPPAGEEP
ncbi:MAG: BlaI/MecI/CopY family transcriptional regulator [Nannocystaceae bacterium]|nr:BlaI/MecI/CopY family transcriptional regulator [Nannocystaceae bacterium]